MNQSKIDLNSLSREDLFNLMNEVSAKIGHFHLVTLTFDDVKSQLEEMDSMGHIEAMPTDEEITEACKDVASSCVFDAGDWQYGLSKAIDLLI
jgi:hypothetical protein